MTVDRESMAEITAALAVSGEIFTSNFDRYKQILDVTAPIKSLFLIEAIPSGFAPEEIRKDWVGLTLPVRFQINIEEVPEIPVIAAEALHALETFGKRTALNWWEDYYADIASHIAPNVDDEGHRAYMSNIEMLVFDSNSGSLQEDPNRTTNDLLAGLVNPLIYWHPELKWPSGDSPS